MPKKIVNRVDRNLARRLREARREVGLSTRVVCEKLPRRLSVSHTTLSSYENGTTRPPVDVLAALADLYSRPLTWFLDSRETLSGFRYRNLKHRSSIAEKRQFEAQASKWAEGYLKLDRFLSPSDQKRLKVPESDIALPASALALSIRQNFLQLDDRERIDNVVRVLESFSAWALEVRTSLGIDGASAQHGNDTVVIFSHDVPNDRLRMAAAQELACILYRDSENQLGLNAAAIEKQAYDFATALLLPHSQLVEAFKHKSLLKLFEYKERFGVSLAAMIHMAEKTRLISTTISRSLWSDIVKRGWQRNEPGFVWRDRAISFEMMLDAAIQTKRITWDDAERITGIRTDELRQRIADLYDEAATRASNERLGIPRLSLFAYTDEAVAET
jgi:transcriptional regulator with XRE-family HTH domain/Zn-dependent peptidase ImmA (M78 family)